VGVYVFTCRHAEFGCGDVRAYIPAEFEWVCVYICVSPVICLCIYTQSLHVCVYIFTYIHTASICMCIHLRICTPKLHVCVYGFTYMDTEVAFVFVYIYVYHTEFTCVCVCICVYVHRPHMCLCTFCRISMQSLHM